jgi:putative hydrolase of the HAD superfamily
VVKVISFDVEGTLVTPQFSQAIWYQAIPLIYADKWGVSLEKAQILVKQEYDRIGSRRKEWYDIKFWFKYFNFNCNFKAVLNEYQNQVCFYPEAILVLKQLSQNYPLIVSSGSSREFLEVLLIKVKEYFVNVFSSISDYGDLKTVDFYSWLCQKMNLLPDEIVHLGDNWEFDFLNAKLAGVNAFYLDRGEGGHSSTEVPEKAENVVRNLKEFANQLSQWSQHQTD